MYNPHLQELIDKFFPAQNWNQGNPRFSDLLATYKVDWEQRQSAQMVHQSGMLLLKIINDILDFSKIEADKLKLEIRKNDLWNLSENTPEIIHFQAKGNK